MSEIKQHIAWPKASVRVRFVKRWCARADLDALNSVCNRVMILNSESLAAFHADLLKTMEEEPGSCGTQESQIRDDGTLVPDQQVVQYCIRCGKCMEVLLAAAATLAIMYNDTNLKWFVIIARFDFDEDRIKQVIKAVTTKTAFYAAALAALEEDE